jgi:hypothetical protein
MKISESSPHLVSLGLTLKLKFSGPLAHSKLPSEIGNGPMRQAVHTQTGNTFVDLLWKIGQGLSWR